MSRIRRSPAAKRDVLAIWTYVAQHHVPTADDVIDRLDARLRALAETPGIGTPRPELGSRLRSFVVGTYTLYYRPVADGIELVRVLHGARDVRSAFRR